MSEGSDAIAVSPPSELPAAASTHLEASLEREHLPLWKAMALSLSAMQLGPAIALAAGSVLPFVGANAWLPFAIATAAIAGVAVAVARCARRYVASGSLISYVYRTLGARARLVTAAALIIGYLVMAGTITATAVVFTASALVDVGFTHAADPWMQCGSAALISGFAAFCAYRGVDASVKVALALGFLCVPFVVYITVAAYHQGHTGLLGQFRSSSPSRPELMQGVMAAFANYVAFDGLTALAAETSEPLRNVPRILTWVLGTIAVAVILACLLQAPLLVQHSSEIAAGASPIAILAEIAGLPGLKTPVDLLLAPAVIASVVALYNFGARVLATAAVDGLLPQYFAAIHRKFHSPHRAVVVLGFAGAATPAAIQYLAAAPPLLGAVYLGNLLSYFWLLPYVLLCTGVVRMELRRGNAQPLVLISAIAGAMFSLGLLVASMAYPAGGATSLWPYVALVSTLVLSAVMLVAVKPSYWLE